MRYFLLVILFSLNVYAQLNTPLVDDANLIPQNKKTEVEQKLRELRTDKDIWLVVWTTPSLNGNPIETISVDQFKKWKLGDEKKDNALLLVVAAQDRKMRMEVGYGLEGDFPDLRVKQLLDDIIRPSLKKNDLASGVLDLIAKIKNTPSTQPAVATEPVAEERTREEVLKTLSPQVIDMTNQVDGDTLDYFNNQITRKREEGVDFWIIIGPMSESESAAKLVPASDKPHRVVLYMDLDSRSATLLNKPDFGTNEEWGNFQLGMNSRLKVAHPINALGGSNGDFRTMLAVEEFAAFEKENQHSDDIVVAVFAAIFAVIAILFGVNFRRKKPALSELSIHTETKLEIQDLLSKRSLIFIFAIPLTFLGLGISLFNAESGLVTPLTVAIILSGIGSIIWGVATLVSISTRLLAMNLNKKDRDLVILLFGHVKSGGGSGSSSSSSDYSSSDSSSSSSSSSDSYSGGGSSGGGGANSDW